MIWPVSHKFHPQDEALQNKTLVRFNLIVQMPIKGDKTNEVWQGIKDARTST